MSEEKKEKSGWTHSHALMVLLAFIVATPIGGAFLEAPCRAQARRQQLHPETVYAELQIPFPLCHIEKGTRPLHAPVLAVARLTVAAVRLGIRYPRVALALSAVLLVALLFGARRLLKLWSGLKARWRGTRHEPETFDIPYREVTCEEYERYRARRKDGELFLGLRPVKRKYWWGYKFVPHYLTAEQRRVHRQIVGKTGSGKTLGVIWPGVDQDMCDGRGVLLIDAKGSDETWRQFYARARRHGRERDVRYFCLSAWNRPGHFSHTYSPTYLAPPTTQHPYGGDPQAMAERLLAMLKLGESEYYRGQAEAGFISLCRVMARLRTRDGRRLSFTVRDLLHALRGAGMPDDNPHRKFLEQCLKNTEDREAADELKAQLQHLGAKAVDCFTGLCAALSRFRSPIVNARRPDIVMEEVLEKGLLVYVQLPTNLFKQQAEAMGRVFLADLQQAASLRQVERKTRSQRPFSVYIDEFANFADEAFVDSINKLRDANLTFILAHQSLADLERVSKQFADRVFDNTPAKDVLAQDSAELCERIAKSIGTRQSVKKTVREEAGPLYTSNATGDASSRLVEEYRVHPNEMKALKALGQGIHYQGGEVVKVQYPLLPPPAEETQLPERRDDPRDAALPDLFEVEPPAAAARPATAPAAVQPEQPPQPKPGIVAAKPADARAAAPTSAAAPPLKAAKAPAAVSATPRTPPDGQPSPTTVDLSGSAPTAEPRRARSGELTGSRPRQVAREWKPNFARSSTSTQPAPAKGPKRPKTGEGEQ